MPRPDQIITPPPSPPPGTAIVLPPAPGSSQIGSGRAGERSTMHRAAAAGLDLGLGLGLGLASQGSLTSSTTTASSSPASHWTAALSSVVGPQESYGLHQYAGHNQPRKEEPGMRTSTSPESGVSAGTKRGLERTGSGVSRAAGSDEDDDGGDGAGGRKKLRLSKDQAAVLEECFKTHSTLNPKQKTALANRLGLRPRQVEVWFQNRRARTKLKQTEVDCEYMKRWCEQLAEQNKRLEKEVAELRALKAAPAVHAQQAAPAATLTMCPSCRRVAATTAGPAATQHQHQQPQQCHPKPAAQPAGNVLPSHCQFFPSTTTAAAPDRSGRQQGAWNGAAQPLVTRELF
ncbi:homeobox-leucine zipper protein HOX2-like [Triticum dicoccoides]|uniref:homeobox-leucine zipper protein HOX2-like n=1 Tax=Triticum dicoccoides TaxID=85692 RepID=UPI00188E0391|nr:homeobox-leucine zipper protein HOX2-like [Triticum dicoccoides]